MNPQTIVTLFTGADGEAQAQDYLRQEELIGELIADQDTENPRIPPDIKDLARLHASIRARKAFTILEFGVGYSTHVMADALLKNEAEWKALAEKPAIRCSAPFRLHSVDTSKEWISRAGQALPSRLADRVTMHQSEAGAGLFHGRACHFYEQLPDVTPDFIYLDGPDPADVHGDVGGFGWRHRDRVVMAGDILRIEPLLLPGTLVVVDGRTANARFLKTHLYRNWEMARNSESDLTAFELQEAPYGAANRNMVVYCLGDRAGRWA